MSTRKIQILGNWKQSGIRVADISLLASGWEGDESPYSQEVKIDGITPYSQVDITPNAEILEEFRNKDIALVTENEDGVVTVFCVGQKLLNDYVMQVTITEVTV